VGGRVPLYSGIGFSSSSSTLAPDRVVGQVQISREQGADGFIIFNMGETVTLTAFPEMAKAITSAEAVMPHNAPRVRFSFAVESEDPVLAVEGGQVTMQVSLADLGSHAVKATGATGVLELQDLEGRTLARLGDLPAVGGTAEAIVRKREGTLRLAAVGTLSFEGGGKKPFILRSRPFAFSGD